jgi:hypothetical protein
VTEPLPVPLPGLTVIQSVVVVADHEQVAAFAVIEVV